MPSDFPKVISDLLSCRPKTVLLDALQYQELMNAFIKAQAELIKLQNTPYTPYQMPNYVPNGTNPTGIGTPPGYSYLAHNGPLSGSSLAQAITNWSVTPSGGSKP